MNLDQTDLKPQMGDRRKETTFTGKKTDSAKDISASLFSTHPTGTVRHVRVSPRTARLVLVTVAFVLAWLFCEFTLRMIWHNPYRDELPDHILKIRMHHPNTDYIFDRSMIDTEVPTVRLRTDNRSYIIPSFQYQHPDATVAFFGGSTTECAAVQEHLRFPAMVSEHLR